MKKHIILIVLALGSALNMAAQIKETFDSNSWQWTEQVSDLGKVYIIDGVLRFDTNTNINIPIQQVAEYVSSHAYLPMDPSAGFVISCDANVDKIDDDKYFGIIMDYEDDMNFMIFTMSKNWAYWYKITEGRITKKMKGQLHLPKQKKANLNIKILYSSGELEIRVIDIPAIKARNVEIKSNGFGFFAYGKTKVDFDNIEILLE